MKKIALLMASAAVAAVISGCTAMQYAPDELKWTTKHSDDEIYGKAVDCATSMLGTPQNGEQFFVYESDKLHKFTTKSWVQIRPNPILTAWASVLFHFSVNKKQAVIRATDPTKDGQPLHWEPEVNSMTEVVVDLEKKFKQCVGE